jgi:hypothetical protein
MKLMAFTLAFVFMSGSALAQIRGVDVQVNEGQAVPTTAQLQTILRPHDFVRDILGWANVDPHCNLVSHPNTKLVINDQIMTLYARMQEAGGANFVTLAFNNPRCGQKSISGSRDFPNTDALRAEFAAYAARVVREVPSLGGISIWNEMNGTWNGGYTNPHDAIAAYCQLSNAVIAAVREVNPTIPIAIGATVGWDIDDWFISMFDVYGCAGKGDPTIWLDVHPYLDGKKNGKIADWVLWTDAVANIRADGITNPFIATEWGGTAATKWQAAHPTGNYFETFNQKAGVTDSDWAGAMWYEMLSRRSDGEPALFDMTGTTLTAFGNQYVQSYGP